MNCANSKRICRRKSKIAKTRRERQKRNAKNVGKTSASEEKRNAKPWLNKKPETPSSKANWIKTSKLRTVSCTVSLTEITQSLDPIITTRTTRMPCQGRSITGITSPKRMTLILTLPSKSIQSSKRLKRSHKNLLSPSQKLQSSLSQ